MDNNPYLTSNSRSDAHKPAPPRRPTRNETARRLAATGFFGGGLLGSLGFLMLIAVIEMFLTPPFKSPPNYGQFMVIVAGVSFYMSMFGLCLGLVPYTTWLGYLPLHGVGLFLIWWTNRPFFASVDWLEAPMVAMFVLFAMPTGAAILFQVWAAWRMSRPTESEIHYDD